LLIRPLIADVPLERVKQPSESEWSAKEIVEMECNNQGSSSKIWLLKMEIMIGKKGSSFIFTQAWNEKTLCLYLLSFIHKLEIETNYALAQEIKTQQGMKREITYSKATYLNDQGMLS